MERQWIRLLSVTLIILTWQLRNGWVPEDTKVQDFIFVDIREFGFKPIDERDFRRVPGDASTMESWDPHVKLAFVADNQLIVYWTRGPKGEVRVSETLVMRALIVDPRSGSLTRRVSWPVRKRYSKSDDVETEGRIFPVKGGHFVVQANYKLILFSGDFNKLKEVELGSPKDFRFAVYVSPGGDKLLVQRLERRDRCTFWWLDSATLEETKAFPAPVYGRDVNSDGGVLPSKKGFYVQEGNRITHIPASDGPSIICERPECEHASFIATPLDGGEIGLQTENAIVIYSSEGVPIWTRATKDSAGLLDLSSSLDGTTFAVEIEADTQHFDGVDLTRDPVFLVYDAATKKRMFVGSAPLAWEQTYSLSPDGSMLAVLHGSVVDIYKTRRDATQSLPN
jgi:hypothetical protein